jgi:hypothetical protein
MYILIITGDNYDDIMEELRAADVIVSIGAIGGVRTSCVRTCSCMAQCSVKQEGTACNRTGQDWTEKFSTVQYSTVQYSIVQYSTVQHSAVQYSAR